MINLIQPSICIIRHYSYQKHRREKWCYKLSYWIFVLNKIEKKTWKKYNVKLKITDVEAGSIKLSKSMGNICTAYAKDQDYKR